MILLDALLLQKHALLGGGGWLDHRPSSPDHHGPLPERELDDGEPLTHLPVQQRQNQEDAACVSPGGRGAASSTGESLLKCNSRWGYRMGWGRRNGWHIMWGGSLLVLILILIIGKSMRFLEGGAWTTLCYIWGSLACFSILKSQASYLLVWVTTRTQYSGTMGHGRHTMVPPRVMVSQDRLWQAQLYPWMVALDKPLWVPGPVSSPLS